MRKANPSVTKDYLLASRSETIEEREHRKAKMLKRISEACFHYFIVPFDWSKAELRWEMLFASRSETIEEREHRKAKMFKRISEACFHYFIVPFDWSKAELRWEMLFASRSETIEERARSESQREQRLFACFEVRDHRRVKMSKSKNVETK